MEKNKIEILELERKNELKNSPERFNSRFAMAEERISKLKYQSIEIIVSEEQKKTKAK